MQFGEVLDISNDSEGEQEVVFSEGSKDLNEDLNFAFSPNHKEKEIEIVPLKVVNEPSESSMEAKKAKEDQKLYAETKDYVAATLNAWNSCPGIVKK